MIYEYCEAYETGKRIIHNDMDIFSKQSHHKVPFLYLTI